MISTPPPMSQTRGKSSDFSCFKYGVKGYISNHCPTRHVNIGMPNEDESDDEEIEAETKDTRIPP